jgi:UDPglucose 6-dehydrogenase
MQVGIIGYGFVGKAVASAYDDPMIVDPLYKEFNWTIDDLIEKCDAIFVCVPTPQSNTGECDTSILNKVLNDLAGYEGVVICKSTASPEFYSNAEDRSGLELAHVPEFLVQATAVNDYLNPHKIVIGCHWTIQSKVYKAIMTDKITFKGTPEFCTIGEASMFKYVANTMLAMKVIINNEYKDLCDKMGMNYEAIANIAKTDPRLGTTHWQVPGPDGKRGFGGACFPKDTAALAAIACDYEVDTSMLFNAVAKNTQYRK